MDARGGRDFCLCGFLSKGKKDCLGLIRLGDLLRSGKFPEFLVGLAPPIFPPFLSAIFQNHGVQVFSVPKGPEQTL